MAPTTAATTDTLKPITPTTIQKKRAGGDSLSCCFSFAAYAKALIHHLRTTCNIPVLHGLSDSEFSSLESSLRFSFPPDLRSILREGLPSSPAFPNWRLSLDSNNRSRGPRPINPDEAQLLAQHQFPNRRAPMLVPIYRHFYIPSTPDSASGNPVFSVRGGRVCLAAFDLAGFFQRFQCFGEFDEEERNFPAMLRVPAWAATAARRIEVWTDLAEETERRRRVEINRLWWGGDGLEGCLEGVFGRLRQGGWGEEEVREMMMMDGGDHNTDDDVAAEGGYENNGEEEAEGRVVWHVRQLSLKLLRAGWSMEDVAYSLGYYNDGCLLEGRGYFFLPRAVECL